MDGKHGLITQSKLRVGLRFQEPVRRSLAQSGQKLERCFSPAEIPSITFLDSYRMSHQTYYVMITELLRNGFGMT